MLSFRKAYARRGWFALLQLCYVGRRTMRWSEATQAPEGMDQQTRTHASTHIHLQHRPCPLPSVSSARNDTPSRLQLAEQPSSNLQTAGWRENLAGRWKQRTACKKAAVRSEGNVQHCRKQCAAAPPSERTVALGDARRRFYGRLSCSCFSILIRMQIANQTHIKLTCFSSWQVASSQHNLPYRSDWKLSGN